MLTTSFYRSNVAQRSKETQREVLKATEGLERLLNLAERGENVGSKKSVEAIDFAIERLEILRSRTVRLGELRQVIEDLENVAREKTFDGRQRVEEITRQIAETAIQVNKLSHEREVLAAQIMAAHALFEVEEEYAGNAEANDQSSDSSYYSNSSTAPGDRVVISDYCKGDWDDKVTEDFPEK